MFFFNLTYCKIQNRVDEILYFAFLYEVLV
jgi:hypothetical protein